jgi:hypothetical protein
MEEAKRAQSESHPYRIRFRSVTEILATLQKAGDQRHTLRGRLPYSAVATAAQKDQVRSRNQIGDSL